jgi:hypothetical protein
MVRSGDAGCGGIVQGERAKVNASSQDVIKAWQHGYHTSLYGSDSIDDNLSLSSSSLHIPASCLLHD